MDNSYFSCEFGEVFEKFFFSKHMWVAIFVSFNPVSKAREQLIPTYWSACVKYRDKQSNACLFVAKILGVAST